MFDESPSFGGPRREEGSEPKRVGRRKEGESVGGRKGERPGAFVLPLLDSDRNNTQPEGTPAVVKVKRGRQPSLPRPASPWMQD